MKKVLIFYGSYGGGHLSAARNIKEHIDLVYGENTQTMLVDCIEYINKTLNKASTSVYSKISQSGHWAWEKIYSNAEHGTISKISTSANKMMSYKLNKLLQDYKPDIIISTHPFSSQMCAILKNKRQNRLQASNSNDRL